MSSELDWRGANQLRLSQTPSPTSREHVEADLPANREGQAHVVELLPERLDHLGADVVDLAASAVVGP